MGFFRHDPDGDSGARLPMIEELERLVRRVRLVPLIAPLFLLVGATVGQVVTRTLELPAEHTIQKTGTEVPRVHIEGLAHYLGRLSRDGASTVDYVTVYREQVEPVERALRRRGVPEATARKIAWPLVENAADRDLDVATVLAVLLIESRGKPSARSFVGARGLMQVMPAWSGHWRACGRDLYDIEDNLCNGTSILAWYYKRANGDERKALLGYNGCVRGTNTRDCFLYPDKVEHIKRQILAEWARDNGTTLASATPARAASP